MSQSQARTTICVTLSTYLAFRKKSVRFINLSWKLARTCKLFVFFVDGKLPMIFQGCQGGTALVDQQLCVTI